MNSIIYQQARKARDARFDGKFYVAVKSTGIFCRPICPAPSPLEKNVEYYEAAQQALHAGFRPCIRCRPDSAPTSSAWQGTSSVVMRGARLLQENLHISIQDLVEKLGIGERHFRNLFNQHLGMAPKAYQLYERLLFAKQLLQQSALTIEEIAQASGVSSGRRLQELFKKHMQITPSQLRKQQLSQHSAVQVFLSYRPPYNWPHLRDFLNFRAVKGMEKCSSNSYARTITIAGQRGWFKATHVESKHGFNVEIELTDMNLLKPIIEKIRRILDLDADPSIIDKQLFQAKLPTDSPLGLRIPGIWHEFEAGCRAILGQQVSVVASINALSKLSNELGVTEGGKLSFPIPEMVAESDLQFLGMPQKRRQTLIDFAQYCADHKDFNTAELLNIKGIGPWTVDYINLRGRSEPDVWLGGDLIIKKQMGLLDLQSDSAAPWRSYLVFHLWNRHG